MTAKECKEYAETHPEVEAYCERFCKNHKIIKDDGVYALKIVQAVIEDYKKKEVMG